MKNIGKCSQKKNMVKNKGKYPKTGNFIRKLPETFKKILKILFYP